MSVKCWASVGQYPFSPIQYFILPVPACWQYGHDALNQSWVDVFGPGFWCRELNDGPLCYLGNTFLILFQVAVIYIIKIPSIFNGNAN